MAQSIALKLATAYGSRAIVSQAQHDLLMIAKMHCISLFELISPVLTLI